MPEFITFSPINHINTLKILHLGLKHCHYVFSLPSSLHLNVISYVSQFEYLLCVNVLVLFAS